MTALIEKTDPQYFEVTSDKLYDRHHYKVFSKTGDHVVVDNWQDAAIIWWNKKAFEKPVVEVIDKPQPKKGFK